MPATAHSLPIKGSISDRDGTPQVVLTERLVGYDTFLTGVLDIGQQRVPVRIITLDDVTVLRPVEATALAGATDTYSGVLHLSHGSRRRTIPEDLALEVARRHRTLDLLDEAELRYALTFLEEATTETIRQARIAVIADAIASVDSPAAEEPESNDVDHSAAAPALVTVDVGGTIGTTDSPGITAALVAAGTPRRRTAAARTTAHGTRHHRSGSRRGVPDTTDPGHGVSTPRDRHAATSIHVCGCRTRTDQRPAAGGDAVERHVRGGRPAAAEAAPGAVGERPFPVQQNRIRQARPPRIRGRCRPATYRSYADGAYWG